VVTSISCDLALTQRLASAKPHAALTICGMALGIGGIFGTMKRLPRIEDAAAEDEKLSHRQTM